MRGFLRVFMIMLALVLMILLGIRTYVLIIETPIPTMGELFEMIIYGCSFLVCISIVIELFKWRNK